MAALCHRQHRTLMRRCTRCNEVLPLTDFVRDRSKATGHRSCCKRCHRKFVVRTHA